MPQLYYVSTSGSSFFSGGMLDDAWFFLRDNGLPEEACDPYTHCPHAGPPGSIDPKGKRKCENDVCDDFSSAWTDERFVWHPIIEKIRVLP